jgi:hypothetical protein
MSQEQAISELIAEAIEDCRTAEALEEYRAATEDMTFDESLDYAADVLSRLIVDRLDAAGRFDDPPRLNRAQRRARARKDRRK